MTIPNFIEKALEGGWEPEFLVKKGILGKLKLANAIFLDHLAWKAVGKVEGWNGLNEAEDKAMSMMWALFNGKTIEQYLETL